MPNRDKPRLRGGGSAPSLWMQITLISPRLVAFTYFAGCGAGVGLVPKSTFGAVEISFSFSTVKFGFSL